MSEEEVVIPPEAYEGEAKERDLGLVHKMLFEIYHPRDDNPQYVIKVKNPETGKLHGTLYGSEEHTASGFATFMTHYLNSNDI